MKTNIRKPETVSHTIQSKTKAANQASLSKVLQTYKEEEEPVQQKPENQTGLPDNLKEGIESLSGYNMDDVKVHYNSSKPTQLQALAYTQGTDIHVAPGQEKHLPHEAWHVVQQKQGRVKPTVQMQGIQVNDEEGLEREADARGNIVKQYYSPSNKPHNNLSQTLKYNRDRIIQYCGFKAGGQSFPRPAPYAFTPASALAATRPLPAKEKRKLSGKDPKSGVKIGDIGSYGIIQDLEQVGDGLTGDHQPSGAAIKEAIRRELHKKLNTMLTRSMAANAYKRAITIVMTDAWHKANSRTYGGRNTQGQISSDAADLVNASREDWQATVPELQKKFTQGEIEDIWQNLCQARDDFFAAGEASMYFQ